jgi:membrane protease YdiL (CAAX protease family)
MPFSSSSKLENLRISHIIASIAIMMGVGFLAVSLDSFGFLRAHGCPSQLVSELQTILVLCAGIVFLMRMYAISPSDFGFFKKKWKATFLWGCAGGLLLGLVQFPYKILVGDRSVSMDIFIDPRHYGINWILVFLFFAIILIPALQEMFYRFYLYWGLRNRFGRFWAYSAPALLFSLGHFPINSGQTVLFLLSSLILTYIYERTQNLGSSIIAHILWNGIWYAAAYLFAWV